MLDERDGPNLFGVPPGADFATAVMDGLLDQFEDQPPEALARVTIYVNTRRMQRRLRDVFDAGPSRLLPKMRLITDLANDPSTDPLPPAISPLRRRLELSQLVGALLDQQPDLAARSALFDLSDSLAALIDEMQGEGVDPAILQALDVTDLSGHWARTLAFLDIIRSTFDNGAAPDKEARQRRVIERLAATWAENPPPDPIIVAGSTGSRGATNLFLQAVAQLPNGAVILPGFDFEAPKKVWEQLTGSTPTEDHPQARFAQLAQSLNVCPTQIRPWTSEEPAHPAWNKLMSLALRPAPVTDQWRSDGPELGDLLQATKHITLLEAPSPRMEAETIALRLRRAVEDGQTAALISPDRGLTRQVAAALDRWRIVPDDSAGVPLALSPPGRLLRHIAGLLGNAVSSADVITILKHPLAHSGSDRGPHIQRTNELELWLRRRAIPTPSRQHLVDWAEKSGTSDPGRMAWATWMADLCAEMSAATGEALDHHLSTHVHLCERLAQGADGIGAGGLWDKAAGRTAQRVIADLAQNADAAGAVALFDYRLLFDSLLNSAEVREQEQAHAGVLIWGTLEARVQGADLTILAGLNEGTWPEAPAPDPWLNRAMRKQAGLLLPERRIGLSAHDFMQASSGAEVWITRSVRSEDAETVASRWLNRLTNLLGGLPDQGGAQALEDMRSKGQKWLKAAARLSEVGPPRPAPRPSPQPPVAARPKQLSVTGVSRLIRDPYAVYAEKVLRLRPLDPLSPQPDAALRGTALHKVFETFVRACPDPAEPQAKAHLLDCTATVLSNICPWPTYRHMWTARVAGLADWFLQTEVERRAVATPDDLFEIRGAAALPGVEFTLTCIADRIDLTPTGDAVIYDYKTGTPPSPKAQVHYDKQLLLEAALVHFGGIERTGPRHVASATYIGLGAKRALVAAPLVEQPPERVWKDLETLALAWQDPERGYSAQIAPQYLDFEGSYDHLARFGEWDLATPITPQVVS